MKHHISFISALSIVIGTFLFSGCSGGGASGDESSEPQYMVTGVIDDWLLKFTDSNRTVYNFFLYVPDGYSQTDNKYPIVIFLHGDDGSRVYAPTPSITQLSQGPLKPLYNSGTLNAEMRDTLNPNVRKAFVVYPKIPCIDDTYSNMLGYWNPWTINKILDSLISEYRIDTTRIYVTGLSFGGFGTWYYGNSNERDDLAPAAIVPICCGHSTSIQMTERLKSLPIWAFHSRDDTVVPYNSSVATVQKITGVSNLMDGYPSTTSDNYTISYDIRTGLSKWKVGVQYPAGIITYTLYASGGHNAWDRTYANDDMWEWLFSNHR